MNNPLSMVRTDVSGEILARFWKISVGTELLLGYRIGHTGLLAAVSTRFREPVYAFKLCVKSTNVPPCSPST